MAANSVWGIDIGQCALKAMKLRNVDGKIQVEAFEVIEHANVLSQPDVDASLLIRASLDEFLRRQDTSDSKVAVSVIGQSSFTRFVKLPPVEEKQIPQIVRFEAEQQIPFPIDEVTWRYQIFRDPDSPQLEVGIFAMKQVDVAEMLSYFTAAGLDVDYVQMAPLALYNMMVYDGRVDSSGATIVADVGADKTHLVIAEGARIWTRTIQIGGNAFTEALVKSFNLSFSKAEKLKRTAASSKYARQIFQVMRPVFADLVQEIQRSIGFYRATHRDSKFKKLIGIGNGFRLPGMQKYLEQNLDMAVERADTFTRVDAPEEFSEHILSFGVAYGLALQGLDETPVETNLLPEHISTQRMWGKKRPWFALAAGLVLMAALVYTMRAYGDSSALESPAVEDAQRQYNREIIKIDKWRSDYTSAQGDVEDRLEGLEKYRDLRAYSRWWPQLDDVVSRAFLAATIANPDPRAWIEPYKQLAEFPTAAPARQAELAAAAQSEQVLVAMIGMLPYEGDDPNSLRARLIDRLQRVPRDQRKLVVLEGMQSTYHPDLTILQDDGEAAQAKASGMPPEFAMGANPFLDEEVAPTDEEGGTSTAKRGFRVVLTGRTPTEASTMVGWIKRTLKAQIEQNPNLSLVDDIRWDVLEQGEVAGKAKAGMMGMYEPPANFGMMQTPKTAGTGEAEEIVINPDPLFPRESMSKDYRFVIYAKIAITGDAMPKPATDTSNPNAGGN